VAGLQERNGGFRILFRYQGKQWTLHLGSVSRQEAEAKGGQVDLLLLRLKQRLIELPPGVTIEEFLICDGQVRKPEEARPTAPVNFAAFKKQYLDTHSNGAMEANSLATVAMHLGHFERPLGQAFPLAHLTLTDLQQHVNNRAKKKYRGKPLSPVTLKKEMAMLCRKPDCSNKKPGPPSFGKSRLWQHFCEISKQILPCWPLGQSPSPWFTPSV